MCLDSAILCEKYNEKKILLFNLIFFKREICRYKGIRIDTYASWSRENNLSIPCSHSYSSRGLEAPNGHLHGIRISRRAPRMNLCFFLELLHTCTKRLYKMNLSLWVIKVFSFSHEMIFWHLSIMVETGHCWATMVGIVIWIQFLFLFFRYIANHWLQITINDINEKYPKVYMWITFFVAE